MTDSVTGVSVFEADAIVSGWKTVSLVSVFVLKAGVHVSVIRMMVSLDDMLVSVTDETMPIVESPCVVVTVSWMMSLSMTSTTGSLCGVLVSLVGVICADMSVPVPGIFVPALVVAMSLSNVLELVTDVLVPVFGVTRFCVSDL